MIVECSKLLRKVNISLLCHERSPAPTRLAPEIEQANRAVRAYRPEDVFPLRKGYVVDFLVVRNELGLRLLCLSCVRAAG